MFYQVISRLATPGACWTYYPSWAPMREREEAERRAQFAAARGHEAVILAYPSLERLGQVARAVVEQQEMRYLPALRYLPAAETLLGPDAQAQVDQDIAASLLGEPEVGAVVDAAELSVTEADQLRLALEDGPGGDVTASAAGGGQHLAFPTRKDVLRAWLRLWARAASGDIGGPEDGASRD